MDGWSKSPGRVSEVAPLRQELHGEGVAGTGLGKAFFTARRTILLPHWAKTERVYTADTG